MLAIGLMTGSSMDGIDGVILETDGRYFAKHIESASLEYNAAFKIKLRELELRVRATKGLVPAAGQELIDELTLLHAHIVHELLRKASLTASQIAVIGFHGQNLYHHPAERVTVQVGNSALLAKKTKISVVNNFRQNDVMHGGQGAPFAPIYHQVLATQSALFPMIFVNCGGIANISFVAGPKPEQLFGFDVGPGNVLIDLYVRQYTKNTEFMDLGGLYGSNGVVNQELLATLEKDSLPGEFFSKAPPKSLDSKDFLLPEVIWSLKFEDACATLEAFTAKMIVASLKLVDGTVESKYCALAGGGWHNATIKKYFIEYLNNHCCNQVLIKTADEYGWNSQFMEAELFAYLAVRHLQKLPLSVQNVTGVKEPCLGGDFTSIKMQG